MRFGGVGGPRLPARPRKRLSGPETGTNRTSGFLVAVDTNQHSILLFPIKLTRRHRRVERLPATFTLGQVQNIGVA